MTLRSIRLPLLTALLLFGAAQARADQVDFTYSWTIAPTVVTGGSAVVMLASETGGGNATVQQANNPSGFNLPVATVTTNTEASQLQSFTTTPYTITFHLTDNASHQSADLTFTGALSGAISATETQMSGTFDAPTTKDLSLGGRTYTVSIDPVLFNVPIPGGSGLISSTVTVTNAVVTPEPSALLLGATALSGFVLRRTLRRRKPV